MSLDAAPSVKFDLTLDDYRALQVHICTPPKASRLRLVLSVMVVTGLVCAAAIAILRSEHRSRISIDRLAKAAAMGPTAFHKHFKQLTSLTPGQYQKRLRLIEARRLMLEKGFSATSAGFEVGYESISQFTREYRRMFQVPPKRDATSRGSGALRGDTPG